MYRVMSKNLLDVESVFQALNLPLIERGIEEIQVAKERFNDPYYPDTVEHSQARYRVVLSNGTGKVSKIGNINAELELRSF